MQKTLEILDSWIKEKRRQYEDAVFSGLDVSLTCEEFYRILDITESTLDFLKSEDVLFYGEICHAFSNLVKYRESLKNE